MNDLFVVLDIVKIGSILLPTRGQPTDRFTSRVIKRSREWGKWSEGRGEGKERAGESGEKGGE
jgi:hypothetical protein